MHFDTGPNRSKFVKFGTCAPGPKAFPEVPKLSLLLRVFVSHKITENQSVEADDVLCKPVGEPSVLPLQRPIY